MWNITVKYFQAEADAVWLILKTTETFCKDGTNLKFMILQISWTTLFSFLGEEIQDVS